MTIVASTISKLLRTEKDYVERAWLAARSVDSAETQPPKEFASGKGALAFALSYFILNQPGHFFLGSLGIVAFVVYGLIHDPYLFVGGATFAAIAWCIYRYAGRHSVWMLIVGVPVVIVGGSALFWISGHHG